MFFSNLCKKAYFYVFFFGFFVFQPLLGQDLEALYAAMQEKAAAENYVEALEVGKQAIPLAFKEWGLESPNLGFFMFELAQLYEATKENVSADTCYVRAVEILDNSLGERDENTLKVLHRQVKFYTNTHQEEKAKSTYEKIKKRTFSGSNDKVDNTSTEILLEQANLQLKQRNFQEAKQNFQEVLGIAVQSPALYHKALYGLGLIYLEEAVYQKADSALGKAWEYHQKHLEDAQILYRENALNLATVYKINQKYALALPLLELGRDLAAKYDTTLLPALDLQLGEVYFALGQYPEAEKALLQSTQKAQEEVLWQTWLLLGKTQAALGKIAEADLNMQQAQDLAKNVLKNEAYLSQTLHEWATLKANQAQYSQAAELFKEALLLRKNQQNQQPDGFLQTALNLGEVYLATQQYVEALLLFQEAQVFAEKQSRKTQLAALEEKMIKVYLLQKNHQAAAPLLEKILQSNQQNLSLELLLGLVEVYLSQKQYEKAQAMCSQALAAEGLSFEQSLKLKERLAEIHYLKGESTLSAQIYAELVQLLENKKSENPMLYIFAIKNLGSIAKNQARYAEASQLFEQSIKVAGTFLGDNSLKYAEIIEEKALLLQSLGSFEAAGKLHQQIFQIRQNQPDNALALAISYDNLGRLQWTLGSYVAADTLLRSALQIRTAKQGTAHPQYAKTLNYLASLYKSMGKWEKSGKMLVEVTQIYAQTLGASHPDYASALNGLAYVYRKDQQPDKAEQLLKEALKIREKSLGKQHPDYATSLDNLANLYSALGQASLAQPLQEEAKNIREQVYGKQHPAVAASYNNLALLEEKLNHLAVAEKYYQKALDIFKVKYSTRHPDYLQTANNLALLYQKQENYEKAQVLFTEMMEQVIFQIENTFPVLSEEEKKNFYVYHRPLIENYLVFVANVYERNKHNLSSPIQEMLWQGYTLQVATKGMVLNASQRQLEQLKATNQSEVQNAFATWQLQKDKLAKAYYLSSEELKKAKIDLVQLEQEVQNLEKTLGVYANQFQSTFRPEYPEGKKICSLLERNEVLIEMVRLKTQQDSVIYVAFVLQNQEENPLQMVMLKDGIELEKKYLRAYRNKIQSKKDDLASYKHFWQALSTVLDSTKANQKIYFVADGVYHQINLLTLLNPEHGQYLSEEVELVLLNNARIIEKIKQDQNSPANLENPRAFLMGNPTYKIDKTSEPTTWIGQIDFPQLAGTASEVNYITKQLKEAGYQTQVFMKEEAKEANLKQINKPTLMHIATHGYFIDAEDFEAIRDNQEDKEENSSSGLLKLDLKNSEAKINALLRSGIVLAGVNDASSFDAEDNILTALEASNLDLSQTDLVVLSACETGLGDVQVGEGVYGLQRALKLAGAKHILLSLWKVDDEATSGLMRLFYSELMQHKDPVSALRAAQEKLREEFPKPYYWGAFVLVR